MTDGAGGFFTLAAAVIKLFAGQGPRTERPKLKGTVVGQRVNERTLRVWASVRNESGTAITIDYVSSFVRGKGRGRGGIDQVQFRSGPTPPFRLDGYSSAEWESKITLQDWMTEQGATCTLCVTGVGGSVYKTTKIIGSGIY